MGGDPRGLGPEEALWGRSLEAGSREGVPKVGSRPPPQLADPARDQVPEQNRRKPGPSSGPITPEDSSPGPHPRDPAPEVSAQRTLLRGPLQDFYSGPSPRGPFPEGWVRA